MQCTNAKSDTSKSIRQSEDADAHNKCGLNLWNWLKSRSVSNDNFSSGRKKQNCWIFHKVNNL